MRYSSLLLTLLASSIVACSSYGQDRELVDNSTDDVHAPDYNELNLAAGTMTLYEVQVRAANACRPDLGSPAQRDACRAKLSPKVTYRAEGMSCPNLGDLEAIRLGTLDDMLEPTADYRAGITVRYVNEKVGANTLWLMPLFPNNDQWAIPDPCDNLGSPYAVRDYMHAAGTLSRACINQSRDEYSSKPCWANNEVDRVVTEAHSRGMKVMLDVALNHFGHNYLMYDATDFSTLRERVARGEDLSRLWDYSATFEPSLLRPELLDTPEALERVAASNPARRLELDTLRKRCPKLTGDELVRGYNVWRVALDNERAGFDCHNVSLEVGAPGFYMGGNRWDPSTRLGDNFQNNWKDVKFIFHREENTAHSWEFVRDREYLFRVLNYWVSRGVDGFRFDHTTDPDGGMDSNEWKYLIGKVDYYAWRRGQARPVYLAEEFHEQMEMNKVVDILTEGYVGDMTGRNGITKNTSHIEQVVNNADRFNGHAFVMAALETHDETRLTDGSGFNMWTGAGFFGIGAAQHATPMLLMGQEFGEDWGLGFRKSTLIASRFVGHGNYRDADSLVDYYHRLLTQRLRYENRALVSPDYAFLRSRWDGKPDQRIFAQARWTHVGGSNVVFVLHNLWEQNVEQSFYIDPSVASAMALRDDYRYQLVDVLSGKPAGSCHTGAQLRSDLYVKMDASTRAQWLRLEACSN